MPVPRDNQSAMFDLADGTWMSSKKGALVNIGRIH